METIKSFIQSYTDNSTVFYGCWIHLDEMWIKVRCTGEQSSKNDVDKQIGHLYGNKYARTTIVPVCKYIPSFLNKVRARSIAKDTFIS